MRQFVVSWHGSALIEAETEEQAIAIMSKERNGDFWCCCSDVVKAEEYIPVS